MTERGSLPALAAILRSLNDYRLRVEIVAGNRQMVGVVGIDRHRRTRLRTFAIDDGNFTARYYIGLRLLVKMELGRRSRGLQLSAIHGKFHATEIVTAGRIFTRSDCCAGLRASGQRAKEIDNESEGLARTQSDQEGNAGISIGRKILQRQS